MQKRSKFQIRSDAAKQRWHVRDDAKEAFWKSHLDGWKKSGLSKRAYCTEHNLAYSSLMSWRREIEIREREKVPTVNAAALLSKSTEKPATPFVPIRLLPNTDKGQAPRQAVVEGNAAKQQVEILLPGGAVIRLNDACNTNFVVELLSALKV